MIHGIQGVRVTWGQTLDSAILDLSSGRCGCGLGFSRPKS